MFIGKKLDKIVKNSLDAIKFQCPQDKGCGKIFSYSDAHKHRKCLAIAGVTCLLGCGDKKLYKLEDEMQEHFIKICPKQRGKCVKC